MAAPRFMAESPCRERRFMHKNKALTLRTALIGVGLVLTGVALTPCQARADEGGLSFWVPGFFGSLAATPQTPGFSYATILYHASVDAGSDVAFARQVTRGRLTAN